MNLISISFATLFFLLSFNISYSQKSTLIFNVDMNPTGLQIKDSTLNVRIKGSEEPLNWVEGVKMTDYDKDGIYSASIDFDTEGNKELIFKYVLNDVEWEGGENLKIEIKLNAKPFNSIFRYVARPGNPFRKFIGEWTLKNDSWEQGYGEAVDRVRIPNHYTICKEINTDNSLLWIINSPNSKGHIFWTYNHEKKEVHWSSNFYSYRSGVGNGTESANGDLTFKLSFEGEPEGTYGLYAYKWISNDEFEMKSVQYNAEGKPTGGFYGGTFVRINSQKFSEE